MSVLSTCINAYLEGRKIVFFGAGQYSAAAIRNIHPQIAYFCDNSPAKQGSAFWGRPVCHPDKLLDENRDKTVIMINTEYYGEIAKQIFDMGFRNIYSDAYKRANERIPDSVMDSGNFLQRKAKVISCHDISGFKNLFADELSETVFNKLIAKYKQGNFDFSDICTGDEIYFNDIFRDEIREDEVYVDAGAYDGKTAVDFILFTKGKYKKIYAFEPDANNYFRLIGELADCRDTVVSRLALSDSDSEATFDARGTQSSRIAAADDGLEEDRFTIIHTTKLDSYVKGPVTFIKMDIEGEEYNALVGAREIIRKQRPKLAVSVYHNDDDLIKIPLLLQEMVPEYKLYLRHHTPFNVDTVLYAKL
jgi:FkbM family methyltransferase